MHLQALKAANIVASLSCACAILFALPTLASAESQLIASPATAVLTTELSSGQQTGMNANTIDGVIVTVADEPLLLSEFQKAIRLVTGQSTRITAEGSLIGGRLTAKDAEAILEQLINQKILTIRVRELGLNLGEDELDAELNNFLQSQNISEDKFSEILKAEGETVESHREEFRKQIETQRFIGRVIRPLVSVTDDQVIGYYLQETAGRKKAERIKLRSLMVEIPPSLSNEESLIKRKNIETIRKEIDAGRPFAELVRLYSDAKDAIKTSGELPARPVNELPEKLRSALVPGKSAPYVIGPIELGSSVFFFEYLSTELGDPKEFERMKGEYEAKLLNLKFRERLDEYLTTERTKVKVSYRDFKISR